LSIISDKNGDEIKNKKLVDNFIDIVEVSNCQLKFCWQFKKKLKYDSPLLSSFPFILLIKIIAALSLPVIF
jgi:hypothetical protein